MSSTFKIFIVGFSVLLVTACAPIPTKRVVYPEITGELWANDTPASNYKVNFSYSTKDACSDIDSAISQSVKTDENGKFVINEKLSWSMFRMVVPADGYAHYNLCVVSPREQRRWFYSSELRTPEWAGTVNIKCDFDQMLTEPSNLNGALRFKEFGCYLVQ